MNKLMNKPICALLFAITFAIISAVLMYFTKELWVNLGSTNPTIANQTTLVITAIVIFQYPLISNTFVSFIAVFGEKGLSNIKSLSENGLRSGFLGGLIYGLGFGLSVGSIGYFFTESVLEANYVFIDGLVFGEILGLVFGGINGLRNELQ